MRWLENNVSIEKLEQRVEELQAGIWLVEFTATTGTTDYRYCIDPRVVISVMEDTRDGGRQQVHVNYKGGMVTLVGSLDDVVQKLRGQE
jgi:hypothetical protein